MTISSNKTILAIAVSLALSACGGSGSGSGTSYDGSPIIGSSNTAVPTAVVVSSNVNGNGATVVSNKSNTTETTNTNATSNSNNTSSTSVATLTDSEVKSKNNALKANSVSTVSTNAANVVKSITGSGAAVAVVDWGLNRNAYAGLSSSKVDATMDTSSGVTAAVESTQSGHGSRMTKVVIDNAPDARVRNYGNINNDGVRAMFLGGLKTYETLANSADVTSNTIVLSNSYTNGSRTTGGEQNYAALATQLASKLTTTTNGHTGLLVVAAGNDGANNADDSTRMASTNEKLKSIYIAVTGVDGNGNQVFNDCGDAKEYCIAAPSTHTLVTNSNSKVISSGTSPATAYIAAEAAKIASNYDWANSSQVKDMIFTNAIAKSNTSEYGVGVYSSNALGGYGRFDKETTLNVNGIKDTYYMTNNISGTGSLIKKGQDTLVLNGNNTYTGSTTVAEGALVLNGKNTSSVTVNNGAALVIGDNSKTGVSMGSVTNNGSFVSQSLADVTINGNFKTTGTIEKYIGSTINVTGKAELDGVLNVNGVAKGYITKSGTTETILSANSVTGSFDKVNVNDTSLTNTTVTTDSKGVYAKMSRNTVGTAVYSEGYKSNTVAKAADVAETVLTTIDNKINNNETLSDSEKAYVADFVSTNHTVGETAFNNSVGTHGRAQSNVAKIGLSHSTDLVQNTLSNNEAWLNYNHNSPKYKVDEVFTDSKDNGVTFGFSHKLNAKQTVGISMSSNVNDYSETLGNVGKSVKTKSIGGDIAYTIKGKVNYPDVYATVGADRIKVENNGKGSQYRIGTGVSKTFEFGDMLVSPDFGVFYTESQLKNIDVNQLTAAEKLVYKQLIARIGLNGQYFVNPNTALFAGVSVQRDLINKTNSISKIAGMKVGEVLNNSKETQGNVSVGFSHKFNNLVVGAEASYEKSKTWSNKSAKVGFSYLF